jgi:hypothetical protein
MYIAQAMCGLTHVTEAALWFSGSLQKYLEWWPAALYEAGWSVLMLMKGSKILRIELNTVHLYQHYSLLCVRPAQLPVLTEVRALSLLEQHPRYIPHRDHAGYNNSCHSWNGDLEEGFVYSMVTLCMAGIFYLNLEVQQNVALHSVGRDVQTLLHIC